MGDITKAFYDRMNDDATLTALLGTYNGIPAIFSTDPVPEGTGSPYVVIRGMSESPFDTKQTRGREIFRDVACYDEDDGSATDIETIMERIRTLFHRHTLTIANFNTVIASVSGMVPTDEDDVFGRLITIRLTIEEA